MKNEYTDLYFNIDCVDHNFRGVGRMIDFFLDALLSLFLASVFFVALGLAAAGIKAVWSFVRLLD